MKGGDFFSSGDVIQVRRLLCLIAKSEMGPLPSPSGEGKVSKRVATCQCLPDEAEAPDIQLFMMAASTRGDGIGREAGLTQCFDDGFAGAI